MIKVTKEDLVKFINSQPDDKAVNFKENQSSDQCGCLMVHYAKSFGYDNFSCGLFSINFVDDDNNRIDYMLLDTPASDIVCNNISSGVKTYKDLKEYLKC